MKKYLYLMVFVFAMVSCQEASDEIIDTIDTMSMENFEESVEPPIRQGEQCYKDNPNLHHRTDVYDIVSVNDSVLLIVPRNEYGDIITIEL
jgi:hypothetical protein